MTYLDIQGITKLFGPFKALNDVSFSIPKGQVFTLLGPSGCGKTTLLRTIAGLETADAGRIALDGRVLMDSTARTLVPPERRGIGMVFQSYALWPHMTVGDNIALGLKMKRLPAAKIAAKVAEVLELVGLAGTERRFPSSMSGGQQQRVSLARALALEPACILFDEPLSNLDVLLRDRMRFEIRELLKAQGITAIYVTHDQSEAMVISDVVLIMQHGLLIQAGSPRDLYQKPRTRFVAEFFGRTNLFEVDLARSTAGVVTTTNDIVLPTAAATLPTRKALVGIRPEGLELVTDGGAAPLVGTVSRVTYLGGLTQLDVAVSGANITASIPGPVTLEPGASAAFRVTPDNVMILEGDAGHG